MAKICQCSRVGGERPRAFRDYELTRADLAWLFGCSERWIGELRARGVLSIDDTLPEAVRRMAAYNAAAERAKRVRRPVPHG